MPQPKLLEDFQAARAALLDVGERQRHPPPEVGPLAVPGGRVIGVTFTLPVDVGIDDEPIGIPSPQVIGMFGEVIAQPSVERNTNGNVVAVHQRHKIIERLIAVTEPVAEVRVHVDDRQPRPFHVVFFHPQHRSRPELIEGEVAAFATVEGRRRRFYVGRLARG